MSCRRRSFRVASYVFPTVRVHNAFDDRENSEAFANKFIHAMFCPVTRTVNTHDADELAILDFRILANSWQIRILFRWEGRVIPVSVLVLHVSGDDVDCLLYTSDAADE